MFLIFHSTANENNCGCCVYFCGKQPTLLVSFVNITIFHELNDVGEQTKRGYQHFKYKGKIINGKFITTVSNTFSDNQY